MGSIPDTLARRRGIRGRDPKSSDLGETDLSHPIV